MYGVKGIDCKDFCGLEKSFVKKLPRGVVAKQRVIDKVTRGYKKDDNGDYLYKDYRVPAGSLVVISGRNLDIPLKYFNCAENGYGYIDYILSDKGIQYMYVLPRSVLYKVHQTALVLSVKDMKNYAGMGYKTWRNGKIFLHIIPYNPNSSYTGSKVLATGKSLNYDKEIKEIVDYWQNIGYIPNIGLCNLEDGTNLCLQRTTVGYCEYEFIDILPLSDKEMYTGDDDSIEKK